MISSSIKIGSRAYHFHIAKCLLFLYNMFSFESFWIHFKDNINHKHGFVDLSLVLYSWGPVGHVLMCWWLYPLKSFILPKPVVLLQCEKSLLLDTGRMDAGDPLLDEILRVERGRQGQGMTLYGSEL